MSAAIRSIAPSRMRLAAGLVINAGGAAVMLAELARHVAERI